MYLHSRGIIFDWLGVRHNSLEHRPGGGYGTRMRRTHPFLTLALAAGALASGAAQAPAPSPASWPGLWGPSRNGEAVAPAAAPVLKELWRRPVAGGYSEIALAGDVGVTMELRSGGDVVVARDAATGRERWAQPVGPTFKGHDGSEDGPIATPALDGADVFAAGPHGHLVALDLASGRERWRHDLVREFGAGLPDWGFGSSPLVIGDLVVIPTGGERSRGLLAFDRTSGSLEWSAPHSKSRGYSSAVIATIAGMRQIVGAAGDRVYGVAPADGRVLWSLTGPDPLDVVANSPIVLPGDRVLYGTWNHSVLAKVTRSGETFSAAEVWRSTRLRAYNGPTLYRDGFLYTFTGPQLLCADASTGEVKWQERIGAGTLMGLGPFLVVLGQTSGELRIVRASPDRYQEVSRTTVFTPDVMSVTGPSLAGGRLLLRNVREMAAFAVTAQ
jgi:outer membrane protein assembly factor BamB